MHEKLFDPETEKRIHSWLEGPYDPETKREIQRLLETDPQTLENAFFKDLSFGTGGMREKMGVGTNRINIYTIRAAAQGLANYILAQPEPENERSVFIGYDTRNNSSLFAEETARVLAANQIRAYLTETFAPTPLVSFGCRYHHCTAAVMITASHNPPEYNGFKVYWEGGGQVVPPHDTGIIEEVRKMVKDPSKISVAEKDSPLISVVESDIDEHYLHELANLQLWPQTSGDLKIIYSNLHGTGIRLVPKGLAKWGFQSLQLVEKQADPNGNFPHAHSPNPEDTKALELGTEILIRENHDLFIATDPDADRMGAVVLDHREAIPLTGNQIACICLHHICSALQDRNELPENAAFVKTIVTTELFKTIAESFGALCIDVLTGFKYIAEQIAFWENSFEGYQYIFGAEESYGYLFGNFVRDKDAISACCLIAEAAQLAKNQNLSLIDRLHQIYRAYGLHRESLTNLAFTSSPEGMEKMKNILQRLREKPPTHINQTKVVVMEDYQKKTRIDLEKKKTTPVHLPESNVIRFWLEDGSKLVIRPSGTEPKVKIYAEVMKEKPKDIEQEIIECDEKLKALVSAFRKEIDA